jgi:hypothetical protein
MSSDCPNIYRRWINEKYLTYGLLILIALLISSTILLGSVPPIDRDALTHHLFVPKLWLQHGGIYEIPEIPFSYYPMNLDLLYMIPLYFGNDIIPKYLHYLFALLTAGLIYHFLKKRIGTNYGLLGAAFFLSIPIIIKLSITVYVDLGLVFFTTASLLLLLQWAEKGFQARFLTLAGLCCGLAAGTKYNGLISIFILTLFVPLIYQQSVAKEKQSNSKAFFYGLLFAIAVLTTFSPWLIRNYVWTGNPIYPLHNSFFHHVKEIRTDKKVHGEGDNTDTLQKLTRQENNAFVSRKVLYHEAWWRSLLLPVRFFYEGRDDDPQFFDGKLTPFLLLLPSLAFLFKPLNVQQGQERKFLLIFSILYFFLTFFQESLRIRYIVPIVPPLVILSMYGLYGIINFLLSRIESAGLQKTLIILLAVCIPCVMLCYNAEYIFSQFAIVRPFPFLLGKIGKDHYITAFRPEYPAIQYVNSHLPPNTKVLCVFMGNRGYYMNFQPVFEFPYGSGFFPTFLGRNICGKAITFELQKKEINYVLVRDNLTVSWLKQLDNQEKACIEPFMNNASTPLFSENGYTFFQIRQ